MKNVIFLNESNEILYQKTEEAYSRMEEAKSRLVEMLCDNINPHHKVFHCWLSDYRRQWQIWSKLNLELEQAMDGNLPQKGESLRTGCD